MKPDVLHKVEEFLDADASTPPEARLELAIAAAASSVRNRGTDRPRGSLVTAATARLHKERFLMQRLVVESESDDEEVRRGSLLLLGELGGKVAAGHLAKLLAESNGAGEDERIDLIAPAAMLGGPAVVAALADRIAHDESIRVRSAAIHALEELAAGGWTDAADPAPARPPEVHVSGDAARTLSGASRELGESARGDSLPPDLAARVERLADVLAAHARHRGRLVAFAHWSKEKLVQALGDGKTAAATAGGASHDERLREAGQGPERAHR